MHIHESMRNLMISKDLENAESKTQNSGRKLIRRILKITSDAHDMGFVRYLRVAFIAVRTTRNYQNHSIGHLECNAELAPPWSSRRVVENALSVHGGRFVRVLLVCAIIRSEMHLECQA